MSVLLDRPLDEPTGPTDYYFHYDYYYCYYYDDYYHYHDYYYY